MEDHQLHPALLHQALPSVPVWALHLGCGDQEKGWISHIGENKLKSGDSPFMFNVPAVLQDPSLKASCFRSKVSGDHDFKKFKLANHYNLLLHPV